jgi:Protein of unknown function (DUF3383)
LSTIPASKYANVLPNVLAAGAATLQLLGICVTQNTRVPVGTVQSFSSAAAVSAFFGSTSHEATLAAIYFAGYSTATSIPAAMLFAQWPGGGVAAYLRSGNVAALGLAAIQALSGSLTIVVDGYTRTNASFSLSSATSFSSAASLIQTALNASLPSEASGWTGVIAAETASVTGSIAGTVLTVTAVTSGTLIPGSVLSGTGVTSGTTLGQQLSGTAGGIGTYAVSLAQAVTSETISASYGQLTITGSGTGTFTVGQTVSGAGVDAGTIITALGTGTGTTGTYFVNLTQTVSSETVGSTGTAVVVAFDSVSGAFTITSGIVGTPSTVTFATGTLSASLLMTAATGATLSQGSPGETPSTFMANIVTLTQNWATFFTAFDPDDGNGNGQKQLFAAWVNTTSNRYAYVCWDTDITPTQSTDAVNSLGQILAASQSSGTVLIYSPSDLGHAAFFCGMVAAINFNIPGGSIDFMYKSQAGLVAGVTSLTVAQNLDANFYSYYGAAATANANFVFFNNGYISGEFEWANDYINQIWLNNMLQLDLMEYFTAVNITPFDAAGYAQVEQALAGGINQAISFGAIVPGITLSSTQIIELNNAAGKNIANTLQTQGWYLYIVPATPQLRNSRGPVTIFFWYTDGGAIHFITLNSIDVQ